jgi:hypothetical protein
MKKEEIKAGLVLICTGKYDQFLQPMLDSIQKHWFPEQKEVPVFLFTDKTLTIKEAIDKPAVMINRIALYMQHTEHKPWPLPTLLRYETMLKSWSTIRFQTTHVFYVDVDALFVKDIDGDVLGIVGEDTDLEFPCDLVGVRHCGFANGGWGSPNTPKESTAYFPEEEYRYCDYLMGGFQGGKTVHYLMAVSEMMKNIAIDQSNGTMAEWHDESHWNWYWHVAAKIYTRSVMGPTFFMAEEMAGSDQAYILALKKDHAAVRS